MKRLYAILAVLLIAECLFGQASRPPVSKEQVSQVFGSLINSTNPTSPENSYLSNWTRDQLYWLWQKNQAHEIQVSLVHDRRSGYVNFMGSGYSRASKTAPWKPYIRVYANEFWVMGKDYLNPDPKIRQAVKDSFLLALVHEICHLRDNKLEFFTNMSLPYEQRVEEEMRVYALVIINAARPLLAQGKKLHRDFLDQDRMLRRCNDNWKNCPEFRQLATPRTRLPESLPKKP